MGASCGIGSADRAMRMHKYPGRAPTGTQTATRLMVLEVLYCMPSNWNPCMFYSAYQQLGLQCTVHVHVIETRLHGFTATIRYAELDRRVASAAVGEHLHACRCDPRPCPRRAPRLPHGRAGGAAARRAHRHCRRRDACRPRRAPAAHGERRAARRWRARADSLARAGPTDGLARPEARQPAPPGHLSAAVGPRRAARPHQRLHSDWERINREALPEVALNGHSNCGKSALLNALSGVTRARARPPSALAPAGPPTRQLLPSGQLLSAAAGAADGATRRR